ncbi:hypothetical protein LCGC14_2652460 [marine sediment metagenome]|uniref:ArnR1-like winged helix-turn-helix domain-containing protein n=1 Tax=marine sediment metagenome TaxID=412755 RepID=A0A0F8ZUI0_9ZZZZ
MKRQKRTGLEIIKEILGIILLNRNIATTRLLYRANLSVPSFKEYTESLIKKELINITTTSKKNLNGDPISRETRHYNLTECGRQYLEDYQVVDNFIEKYGMNEEDEI